MKTRWVILVYNFNFILVCRCIDSCRYVLRKHPSDTDLYCGYMLEYTCLCEDVYVYTFPNVYLCAFRNQLLCLISLLKWMMIFNNWSRKKKWNSFYDVLLFSFFPLRYKWTINRNIIRMLCFEMFFYKLYVFLINVTSFSLAADRYS